MSEAGVVIVGAGHAGVALATALRAQGYAGPVALIHEEAGEPYQRPPLSKAFLKGEEVALALQPPGFFAAADVALVRERAVGIDRERRRVRLSDGGERPYEALVLAVGARNRALPVPGAEHVLELRTLADAMRLRQALGGARRVAVIGAGFIGLEFAATAALKGAAVSVVDAAPRALGRSVSEPVAAHLVAYHESFGTRFLFEAAVASVEEGDCGALSVQLADRAIAADLVVAGIGVVPNVELARDAGLDVGDGVLVDGSMRTSDPAIFAIGDCAGQPSPDVAGGRMRFESVQNANDGARALAAILAGREPPAPPVPWFWSDQGALKLQIAGLGRPQDEVIVQGGEGPALTALRYREGTLAAVETVNRPGDHMAARRLIGRPNAPSLTEARAGPMDLRKASKAR